MEVGMRLRAGVSCAIVPILLATAWMVGCSMGKETREEESPDPHTLIVNLATDDHEIYIGRRANPRVHMLTAGVRPGQEGWLGNPHPIGMCELCEREHTRAECIESFRADFHARLDHDPEFRKTVLELAGKRLGCYCKPLDCHGDVIREFIDAGGGDR